MTNRGEPLQIHVSNGSKNALPLLRDFAGHQPQIEPLLTRRGLDGSVG